MNSNFISGTYGPVNELSAGQTNNNQKTAAEAQESFKQALNQAITNVNDRQIESNEMTSKLASGDVDNLHEVMVAAEKASVTLQTTVEVRNKALESYKEIMRMQV